VNFAFVRREWGAITFVLTVIVGMIVVPLALYFTNTGPSPVAVAPITTVSSPRAGGATPTPATGARTSPTPTPTKSP